MPNNNQPVSREISKNTNRKEILLGARRAIIECGFANTTISNIIERTTLSRGMINLHFHSKDALLLEVVKDFHAEYVGFFTPIYDGEYDNIADKIRAIFAMEFDPRIMNEANVKLWFALRAEAHAHPDFLPFVNSRDLIIRKNFIKICDDLNKDGKYNNNDIRYIANALICLLEGMWSDYHLNYNNFNRDHAVKVCILTISAFFPKYFNNNQGGL